MKKSTTTQSERTLETLFDQREAPAAESTNVESSDDPLGFLTGEEGSGDQESEYGEDQEFGDDQNFDEEFEAYDDDPANDDVDGEHDDAGYEVDYGHGPTTTASGANAVAVTVSYSAGMVFVAAGLTLILFQSSGIAAESVGAFLSTTALTPVDFVLVGMVLAGLAGVWRRQHHHEATLEVATQAIQRESDMSAQIHDQLNWLVENQENLPQPDTQSSPKAIQQVLHLVERQQEKIANLSKATKMYGKPLLEITNQISESSHTVSELAGRVDAVKVILEQSTNRLEGLIEKAASSSGGADGLEDAIRATRETVSSLEALQRDLSHRLTEKTDRLATDLVSTSRDASRELETLKKDLATSFEETAGKITDEMAQLDQRVEHARAAMVTGMEKLMDGEETDSPELAPMIENVQRQVAMLHEAITNGDFSAPAGDDGKKSSSSGSKKKGKSSGGGSGGGGKGVQSAIAKLKQMRS